MHAWPFYHNIAAGFCLHYREGLERIDEQDIGEHGRLAPLLWISVEECRQDLTEETAEALAVAHFGGIARTGTSELAKDLNDGDDGGGRRGRTRITTTIRARNL
ncbi:hypothetical protein BHE74_00026843 [Ensete ventricosum]|nr:hypothetical protein BHE74_00026843 [Ensete ventricosum]